MLPHRAGRTGRRNVILGTFRSARRRRGGTSVTSVTAMADGGLSAASACGAGPGCGLRRHRPIVTQGGGAWTSPVRYERGAAGRVCTALATYGEIIAAYGCGLAAGRTAARNRHRGSDRIPVRARAA